MKSYYNKNFKENSNNCYRPPPALSMCFPPHRKPAQNSSNARKYYFYISLPRSFIEIHRASVITIFTSAVLPTLLPRPPTATIFLKGIHRHKISFLSSHCVRFCKMVKSDPKYDRIDQVRFLPVQYSGAGAPPYKSL